MAAKSDFWKVCAKPLSNTCLVELSEQWKASTIQREPSPCQAPGVSTPGLDNACLNGDIVMDELSTCIECWISGKSPGIAGRHDQRWWIFLKIVALAL